MLLSLAIRDVVLIERLKLEFTPGLSALTGETGAGKSILLDSLGLALGSRAESGLLRQGAQQASVTAAFDLGPDSPASNGPAGPHPARTILRDHEIDSEDDHLVLRRVLGKDGRGRAYVNDQPVSVSLLRKLGDALVEIQGQFEQRGLLDSANHRGMLDAYGVLDPLQREVAQLYRAWQSAVTARKEAESNFEQARHDEAFLRHAVEELEALDPEEGEEARLAEQRSLMMNAEKLVSALNLAERELTGGDDARGAEDSIAAARNALERASEHAGERIAPALDALERAIAECEDALGRLHTLASEIEMDPGRQEEVEERFFTLRETARKHGVAVDDLPALHRDFAERLAAIDSGSEHLSELARQAQATRDAYAEKARALSKARAEAAKRLDKAVNAELPPLRLEKAAFRTRLEPLEESAWTATGVERVVFEVATNPGASPGPLGKIASGGELSRFLLALKVVLAEVSPERTLVFDEVDSGIGGATAHAVGERLARLARGRQILAVTHSPQVAARADHHWRVAKTAQGNAVVTDVSALSEAERREEIARMLSGAEVTDEARAAAAKLMGAA